MLARNRAVTPLDGRRVDASATPRRAVGTRLLREAARLAGSRRTTVLVLRTRADDQAALAIVLASGLRGRIRVAGERLTVRIPVADRVPSDALTG